MLRGLMTVDGEPMPAEELCQMRWLRIDGTTRAQQVGDFESESHFRLDPAQSPKAIDMLTSGGNLINRGIYHLEDNRLTNCEAGEGRPQQFASTGEQERARTRTVIVRAKAGALWQLAWRIQLPLAIAAATERILHEHEQGVGIVRLAQIKAAARGSYPADYFRMFHAAENHDRDVTGAAVVGKLLTNCETIDVRQAKIEHDQVGTFVLSQPQAGFTSGCGQGLKAL